MDITVYNKLYDTLEKAIKEFNKQSGIQASISGYEPASPKYPLVVFEEIRNQPYGNYDSPREPISSMGYKVSIFAKTSAITLPDKTKKTFNKQEICRELTGYIANFLQYKVGLTLISNNSFPTVGTQGELYEIILVFQRNYNIKKQFFY